MVQELLCHDEGHGPTGRHLAAPEPDPLHLEQLVDGAAADRHAADFLDLGPGDGLMIGDDRQGLDRGTRQLARLDRFLAA